MVTVAPYWLYCRPGTWPAMSVTFLNPSCWRAAPSNAVTEVPAALVAPFRGDNDFGQLIAAVAADLLRPRGQGEQGGGGQEGPGRLRRDESTHLMISPIVASIVEPSLAGTRPSTRNRRTPS